MRQLLRTVSSCRRIAPAAAVSVLMALAGGCGPRARVELRQPRGDGRTRTVYLESGWAHFAPAEACDRLLFAWALPGARTGPKHYQLYLRLPAGGGTFRVAPDADHEGEAAGFLIQKTGRLAGLTNLRQGAVTVSPGNSQRTGSVDVQCTDGTKIRGDFRAARSDLTVRFFEDDHAADVRALAQREN